MKDPVSAKRRKLDHPHDGDNDAIYVGGSYKSSMFKLQVDEMLAEVQPNYEKRGPVIDEALRTLKGLIEGIEDREGLSIPDATKLLQKSYKVAIPFPDPKPDNNAAYKLAYAKPSNVNVVGSYGLRTMVKSDSALAVDMIVKMPDSIFQEKDFLNYRYFYKRAYYLACIAAGLQKAVHEQFLLAFECLNGNSLHPILVVRPRPKDESKADSNFAIHILPAAPENFFAESKLRPIKNSIRPKEQSEKPGIVLAPSPFYNASLKSDCNFESYLKLLHSTSKQSASFRDSCILGRIWLRQRGFGSAISKGGFGHFEWAILTALLVKGGGAKGHSILSPGYSSYQMFKGVLQFLCSTDLTSKPLSHEAPSDFQPPESDIPVFYDGPRGQNVLYKMTPWSYALLRDESKTSMEMLNDDTFDQFESTFILRTDQPLHRFDCLVRIPVPNKTHEEFSGDHETTVARFTRRIFGVLREGLTDRVRLIHIEEDATQSWSLKTSPSSLAKPGSLLVAVVFNPLNIERLVDHGPSAEDKKKAAKFQKFWGEKAELRRFKDGSILESLVWSPGSSYSIFREIMTYLIKRHFDADASTSITFIGGGLEKILGAGTSSKTFEALKQAFNNFEKDIRDMETLPLQLRQLSAICPQLRYSSIQPPTFSPQRPMKQPADVLIQFEGSGRWPDDLIAIQRTKIAFLLKIGSLLEESGSTTTRLGLENEESLLQNCAFLDITYEPGPAFRLRIQNDREQALLERLIKDRLTDNRAREDAVAALSIYKRTFIQLPLLNQSIATHCTRFPLLSSTIRLMKQWFDRHMLSRHISEELIELLVARTFVQPYPWRAPSSATSGFLRTLLFISRWDWRLVPLIVDFTGTMTTKEVASIHTRLEAWRKIDPGMNRTVLFAASNYDITGTAFTDAGPSKMVAARMTALARSACKLVKDQNCDLDHRLLFASSTVDYDFVIYLAPKISHDTRNPRAQKFKNLEVQAEADLELIGYEPVRAYLHELERLYTSTIIFFYSAVSGSAIAGLWNPHIVPARSFKVNLAYATKPENGGDEEEFKEVKLDKSAILSEIARIGGDMVSRIEVLHSE